MPNKPALSGIVNWNKHKVATFSGDVPSIQCGKAEFSIRSNFEKSGETCLYKGTTSDHYNGSILTAVFGRIVAWPESNIITSSNQANQIAGLNWEDRRFPVDLAGDFAIAIWNDRTETLTLMKDHMGTRPLYFVRKPGLVAFASNMAALLPFCDEAEAYVDDKIIDYLNREINASDHLTMHREIFRVPPATKIVFSSNNMEIIEYWKPEDVPRLKRASRKEYFDRASELLVRCIEDRAGNLGHLATHMSGGLDSSVISSVAARHRSDRGLEKPIGFCWQPEALPGQDRTTDQNLFDLCKREFQISGIAVGMTEMDMMSFVEVDPVIFPTGGMVALEAGVMREASKRNINLILSGWGGDQVFSFSGRSRLRNILPIVVLRWIDWLRGNRDSAKSPYLNEIWRRESNLRLMRDKFHRQGTRATQIAKIRLGQISDRLDYWSVLGAEHDLQYAYPMLDRRLIEFALGVPSHVYIEGKQKRNLMRQAVKELIPEEIRLRSDKTETARSARSLEVLKNSASLILKKLEANEIHEDRLKYLNLEKITEDVEKMGRGEKVKFGRLLPALSMLLKQVDRKNDA